MPPPGARLFNLRHGNLLEFSVFLKRRRIYKGVAPFDARTHISIRIQPLPTFPTKLSFSLTDRVSESNAGVANDLCIRKTCPNPM
jgi:hypothetical protein